MRQFEVAALTPLGSADPAIAIGAIRAGGLGILDLEAVGSVQSARNAIGHILRYAGDGAGIRLDTSSHEFAHELLRDLPQAVQTVVLSAAAPEALPELVQTLRAQERRIWLEVLDVQQAAVGRELGVDGLVAKGNEAGGWVGQETTFILLQRLLVEFDLPVLARGGIGIHTAAACFVGGAAGIVLDCQLALTRESRLPEATKAAISRMDGSETVCFGAELGHPFRLYTRPGLPAVEYLRAQALELTTDAPDAPESAQRWRQAVAERVGWGSSEDHVWPLGEDAAFAAPLAERYRTVGGVLGAIRDAISSHSQAARRLKPLAEASPLATSHGTRYPIVQGPMTRVSDRPEFALAVAEEGGAPFVALALMSGAETDEFLSQMSEALGDRPWGVGTLGFLPADVLKPQTEVILRYRPPLAVIAGGKPEQARALEQEGIATYLHIPSPELLRLFLQDGARRFVFEGREAGGHIGPRSSFPLWNTMIDVLLDELSDADAPDCHVLFAGGIHDARSSAMVSALAAPLAERGVKVGVVLGTAYLFTQEAVAAGAIVPTFQEEALRCQHTAILESSPGHAIRCISNPYAEEFQREKHRLLQEGRTVQETKNALDELNVGRLRVASRGVAGPPTYDIDLDAPGFTKLSEDDQRSQGAYMIGQVAALRDSVLTIRELHHEVAVGGAQLLEGLLESPERADGSAARPQPAHIAIIGISAILPRAQDVRQYWENILNKVSTITEVPPSRWDAGLYYDPDRAARDKIYSKWGGFLDEVPFDPTEWGMPPSSLSSIDPMHLLALLAARAALQDAGYLDRAYDRDRTGVVLGVSGAVGDLGTAYALRAGLPLLFGDSASDVVNQAGNELPEWTEDSFPGILLNVAAGRISNRFDLGGPNYVVDAACASSLAAVDMAARELITHNADLIIAGGVDAAQNPFGYLCFSKTQALSPTGETRAFDAAADGIVIGEGIVLMVLKRLADAERDGDRIYALIQGIGSSSDGRARSLTAPHPQGQLRALRRAYQQSGISPATVELFEAHGTGTVAGDQAEMRALGTLLEEAGAETDTQAVGSVKSVIGHTKATAGAASLAKAALALHHKVLPPTLGVTKPLPEAEPGNGPLYVNTEPRPWVHGVQDHPRRAGVSAFGFGGTNFHAVVEEYTGDFLDERQAACDRWPTELLIWAGSTRQELASALGDLHDALRQGATPELRDLAFSLWRDAAELPDRTDEDTLRLAIIAESMDDLLQKLPRTIEALNGDGAIPDPRGIYFTDDPLAREGKMAFLFPGQGSQYPNMLRDLAIHLPEAREAFERADRALAGVLPQALSRYVFPPPAFTPAQEQAQRAALTQTNVAQPALGAACMAIFHALGTLDIQPDLLAGHSYGEYAALAAAGVCDEADLARLSEVRGRRIIEAAGDDLGTMAAVQAGQDEVADALEGIDQVWIANLNAPQQTVISGSRQGVGLAMERLESRGIRVRPIPVACAFHSPLVAPAQERLAEALSEMELQEPRLTVFSNTTAGPYPDEPHEISELLSVQLGKPVRFVEEIEAMYEAGARLFVEVGPGKVLTGLTDQILEGRAHAVIATDLKDRHGLTQLQHAVGQLAAHGVPVRLDALFEGRQVRRLNLKELVSETQDEPLSPTTVMVSGEGIRPADEPRVAVRKPPVFFPQPEAHLAAVGARDPGAAAVPPTAAPPLPSLGVSKDADAASRALLQHQQLMQHFLTVQNEVLTAYLRAGPSAAAEAAPSPAAQPDAAPAVPTASPAEAPAVEPDAATVEPAAVPSEAAPPDTKHLVEQLLEIASERTGYPPDMLDLDANIEADLGIDSIKRVEILSALQKTATPQDVDLAQDAMEQLSNLGTLREIIEWFESALGDQQAVQTEEAQEQPAEPTAQDAATVSEPQDAAADESEIHRITVAVADAPTLDVQPPQFATDAVIVLTDDGAGVADALAEKLRDCGATVAKVALGTDLSTTAEGAYEADLTDPAAVAELLDLVRQNQGPLAGIVHLLPLAAGADLSDMDLKAWRKRLRREVKSLFYLARSAGDDLKLAAQKGGAWLIGASAMGGAWTVGRADAKGGFPGQAGIAGFIKTAAREWPDVRCKAVDLDPANDSVLLAEQLFAEMGAQDGLTEVGYEGATRRRVEYSLRPLDNEDAVQLQMESDWVVLVTGGARGITAEVAHELAQRYQPTLLLVGASPPPPPEEPAATADIADAQELKAALATQMRDSGEEVNIPRVEAACSRLTKAREIRANLNRIQQAGATVRYYQTDVRDEAAFAQLIEQIYEEYGRLDGIIHGAGVIEDKLIEDKTPESFDRVFDTKADSAFILSRAIQPDSLKFLAIFSSTAGAFGNRGQCDYAATNEVLNKLAMHLDRAWPGRVVAIGWGPWAKRGMVSAELQREFAKQGVALIPLATGRRKFAVELERGDKGDAEVIVGGGHGLLAQLHKEPTAEVVLPFLQDAQSVSSSNGVTEAVRVLDPARDLYLNDHRLDGKPVLPLAVATELIAEIANCGRPGLQVAAVRDLQLLRGIVLDDGPKQIRLVARPEQRDRPLQSWLRVSAEITDGQGARQPYYRGTVELAEALPEPPSYEPPFAGKLQSGVTNAAEAYAEWLFHGPLLRGIGEIEGISEAGVAATLMPSSPRQLLAGSPDGEWLIDPVLFDCLNQLVLVWGRNYHNTTFIPTRFASYLRFARPMDPGLRGYMELVTPYDGYTLEVNLYLVDPHSRLLAMIEKAQFAGSKDLNRLAGQQ